MATLWVGYPELKDIGGLVRAMACWIGAQVSTGGAGGGVDDGADGVNGPNTGGVDGALLKGPSVGGISFEAEQSSKKYSFR